MSFLDKEISFMTASVRANTSLPFFAVVTLKSQ